MKKLKQLCFPWSAKKEPNPRHAGLSPQGIADLDRLNNQGVNIPGGLAGIRERMAAMGHFTNGDEALPPKPEAPEGQTPHTGPATAGAPSAVPQGSTVDPQAPKPVRKKKVPTTSSGAKVQQTQPAGNATGGPAAAPQEPKGMDFVITADVCTEDGRGVPVEKIGKNEPAANRPPVNQEAPAAERGQRKAARKAQSNDLGSGTMPIALGNSAEPVSLGNGSEPIALGNGTEPQPSNRRGANIPSGDVSEPSKPDNIAQASHKPDEESGNNWSTRNSTADLDAVAGSLFPGRDQVKLSARQLIHEGSRETSPGAHHAPEQAARAQHATRSNAHIPAAPHVSNQAGHPINANTAQAGHPAQATKISGPIAPTVANTVEREASGGSVSTPKKNFQNAISLFKNQEQGVKKGNAAPVFKRGNSIQNQETVISRVATHETDKNLSPRPQATPSPGTKVAEKSPPGNSAVSKINEEQPPSEIDGGSSIGPESLDKPAGALAQNSKDQVMVTSEAAVNADKSTEVPTEGTESSIAETSLHSVVHPPPVSHPPEETSGSTAATPPTHQGLPSSKSTEEIISQIAHEPGSTEETAVSQVEQMSVQSVQLPSQEHNAAAASLPAEQPEPMVIDNSERPSAKPFVKATVPDKVAYDHHDQRNHVGKREKEGQSPTSTLGTSGMKRMKSVLQGQDKGKDIMLDSVIGFRRANPRGTFHDWLVQLTPEDITRAIMSSDQGTGIWRELWDSVQPEDLKEKGTGGGGSQPSAARAFPAPHAPSALQSINPPAVGPAHLQSGSYAPHLHSLGARMGGPPTATHMMAHNLPAQASRYDYDIQI